MNLNRRASVLPCPLTWTSLIFFYLSQMSLCICPSLSSVLLLAVRTVVVINFHETLGGGWPCDQCRSTGIQLIRICIQTIGPEIFDITYKIFLLRSTMPSLDHISSRFRLFCCPEQAIRSTRAIK